MNAEAFENKVNEIAKEISREAAAIKKNEFGKNPLKDSAFEAELKKALKEIEMEWNARRKEEREAQKLNEELAAIQKEHDAMMKIANKAVAPKSERKVLNAYLKRFGMKWEYMSAEEREDFLDVDDYNFSRPRGKWILRTGRGKEVTAPQALEIIKRHLEKKANK